MTVTEEIRCFFVQYPENFFLLLVDWVDLFYLMKMFYENSEFKMQQDSRFECQAVKIHTQNLEFKKIGDLEFEGEHSPTEFAI